MQAEAGQQLEDIVRRKEWERLANDGTFCWGVGNAPNRCTPELARDRVEVDALFSIMKSRPKIVDVAPSAVVIWRKFVDFDGRERAIPKGSLVTSRGDFQTRLKRSHFALFCRTESPLVLGDFGSFDPTAYRNVGEIGGAIGPSQVTALLRRTAQERSDSTSYRINLKAKMFGSYWAKLTDPIPMDIDKQQALSCFAANRSSATVDGWADLVQQLRDNDKATVVDGERQMNLF
jgi:uncharacterized protein (DUF1697 family)